MKFKAIILACILCMPVLRTCKGAVWEYSIWFSEAESCQSKHACCSSKAPQEKEDHSSDENKRCSDGCSCYCCVPVIVQPSPEIPSFAQSIAKYPLTWLINSPGYDFNPQIWQPPPFSFDLA